MDAVAEAAERLRQWKKDPFSHSMQVVEHDRAILAEAYLAANDPVTPAAVAQRCSSCHWWTGAMGTKDGRNVCVWHTGSKDAKNRNLDFGGNKSLRTLPDFGCTCWEVRYKNDARPDPDLN